MFSLQWGHLEKWLIQFWNRLLIRINHRICDFPNFSTRSYNSRFSSVSGVFSALGALRKVVDSVLESSTHTEYKGYVALGDVEHIEATKERVLLRHNKRMNQMNQLPAWKFNLTDG